MATQNPLQFGNINLSDPIASDTDGYNLINPEPSKVDYIEHPIPKTSSAIQVIMGNGNTEQTAFKLEFEAEKKFNNISSFYTWLKSIAAKTSNSRNNLDTLSFSLIDDPTVFHETNMEMKYKFNDLQKDGDGSYYCKFTVSFRKWG